MSLLTRLQESKWLGGLFQPVRDRQAKYMEDQVEFLSESIAQLQIDLENEGYRRLTVGAEREFDRQHLETLVKLNIAMALKNPLINRMVNVQSDYVFGRGVKFVAAHPMVQKVIDEHVDYCENQKVLYSHDSMSRQERELVLSGNLFFALYTNGRTGRVTVRDIPVLDVVDIVRDPNDFHNEWFIKRQWTDGNNRMRTTFHPALGIDEGSGAYIPKEFSSEGPYSIDWTAPVYHAAFNRYGRMKFAIPEVYPSIDWALAYKKFLENWSSIMAAFARMAMKISGLTGKKQMGAAKSQLQTSVNLSNPNEKNPSETPASTGLFSKGMNIEPVKTAGATTSASEGQPLLNMVASGGGLPNTFFGDASQARGDQLDRPTELKMVARQRLWAVIFDVIFRYVVLQSAKAIYGELAENGAKVVRQPNLFNDKNEFTIVMPPNADEYYGAVGEPVNTGVQTKFPELLERNVTDRVRALVNAVTQFGKPLSDIIPDKRFVCKLLMEALNIDNADAYIPGFIEMWQKNMAVGDDNKPVDPLIIPPLPALAAKGAEDPSQGGDTGANG